VRGRIVRHRDAALLLDTCIELEREFAGNRVRIREQVFMRMSQKSLACGGKDAIGCQDGPSFSTATSKR